MTTIYNIRGSIGDPTLKEDAEREAEQFKKAFEKRWGVEIPVYAEKSPVSLPNARTTDYDISVPDAVYEEYRDEIGILMEYHWSPDEDDEETEKKKLRKEMRDKIMARGYR